MLMELLVPMCSNMLSMQIQKKIPRLLQLIQSLFSTFSNLRKINVLASKLSLNPYDMIVTVFRSCMTKLKFILSLHCLLALLLVPSESLIIRTTLIDVVLPLHRNLGHLHHQECLMNSFHIPCWVLHLFHPPLPCTLYVNISNFAREMICPNYSSPFPMLEV
ncbi:hypothetical protein L218DRAFT_632783 [Marasmius fiardii PR-910]|nr:hypothetical protein L218DRAFT_632783 [Marasmius fiardii PR-910]